MNKKIVFSLLLFSLETPKKPPQRSRVTEVRGWISHRGPRWDCFLFFFIVPIVTRGCISGGSWVSFRVQHTNKI